MLKHDTCNFECCSYIHLSAFIKSFVLLVVRKKKKNKPLEYLPEQSRVFSCLVVFLCCGLVFCFCFVFKHDTSSRRIHAL